MKKLFNKNKPEYLELGNLIKMSNGVLGISVLTMPFCFEQCGIILGLVALALSGFMTSYSCKLLLKSARSQNCMNLEHLAMKIFGYTGKILIEISIILLLFGSLVTYQQTINYSVPSMISKFLNIQYYEVNNFFLLLLVTTFITLPLSLSKKLDQLNKFNYFSIVFYGIFSIYLIWLASIKIEDGFSVEEVKLWKFSGLFKSFPIFCVSFSVQTCLFHIYDELPVNAKGHIIDLLDMSMIIAFSVYAIVGVFGYIAFHDIEISGSFMQMIPNSFISNLILFGLNVCTLSGLPYMVFPCRGSINTLLYLSEKSSDADLHYYSIPDMRFKQLTIFIVYSVALTAILIPNIEFVLSFTGATTGVIVCYIWPSLIYLFDYSNSKKNNFRIKLFLFIGIIIFCICTMATLLEYEPTKLETSIEARDELITTQVLINKDDNLADNLFVPEDEFQIQKSNLKEIQRGLIFQKIFKKNNEQITGKREKRFARPLFLLTESFNYTTN